MGTDWWYKIRRGFLCSASVHMSFFHLFPTFSSFSRQTDIHGCSWSIGKALGISEHWQLQVHCYFLSTEGPRMTTFVRGTKAVVYWCLLPSWPRDFLMAQEEAELFPAEIEVSTEPKRCKPPWHHDLNTATECSKHAQTVSKCVKPVCKADNIVDSCIWRKSALLFHKILLRRSPGTWDWRRPRLNVLKIAERWYKHGLKHSRSSPSLVTMVHFDTPKTHVAVTLLVSTSVTKREPMSRITWIKHQASSNYQFKPIQTTWHPLQIWDRANALLAGYHENARQCQVFLYSAYSDIFGPMCFMKWREKPRWPHENMTWTKDHWKLACVENMNQYHGASIPVTRRRSKKLHAGARQGL